MTRFLDSAPMLKMAARRSGTTNTEGLEDMTLSMIKGDRAFPEKEMSRLVRYLTENGKPDIIHLSNALIIGLARQLKKHMDVKIVCSLLNEDDWIDEMAEPYRSNAWRLISEEAPNVDMHLLLPAAITRSCLLSKTGFSGKNMHIIPLALDTRNLNILPKKNNYPAVGYFSRINSQNGFDKLVDAFIDLKTRATECPVLLFMCQADLQAATKPFIAEQIRKIKSHGLKSFVRIYPEFQWKQQGRVFQQHRYNERPGKKA